MVMKSGFIHAYVSKCTEQHGLYNHILPPYSKHRAPYQSEIRVGSCLTQGVLPHIDCVQTKG